MTPIIIAPDIMHLYTIHPGIMRRVITPHALTIGIIMSVGMMGIDRAEAMGIIEKITLHVHTAVTVTDMGKAGVKDTTSIVDS